MKDELEKKEKNIRDLGGERERERYRIPGNP